MSIRVTDPEGVVWVVSREWFARPAWSRESPDPGDDILEDAGDRLSDAGLVGGDTWWATALVFLGGLVVSLIFFVLFPLVFALLGVLAALGVLGARLLTVSRWTVTARSARARLEWRIRGTLRSARAVREIATALDRGDALPVVDGRQPSAVEAAPV